MHPPTVGIGVKERLTRQLGFVFPASLLGVFTLLQWVPLLRATEANLTSVSPFLSDSNGAPTPTASLPLELRGIMTTPRGTLFAICDPAQKYSGTWVGLNETGSGFVVRSYRVV